MSWHLTCRISTLSGGMILHAPFIIPRRNSGFISTAFMWPVLNILSPCSSDTTSIYRWLRSQDVGRHYDEQR